MTDHTQRGAGRELRDTLKAAKLENPFLPREIRAAVPLVIQILEQHEDLIDRFTIMEKNFARLARRVNALDRLDGVFEYADRCASEGAPVEQAQSSDRNLPMPGAGV